MKDINEWFNQADYDFDTATYIFSGQRYVYAVFMCHLAIEKALKGVVSKVTQESPPRTHSLIQLTKKAQLNPPENIAKFLVQLDQASIPTRYPETLSKMHEIFNKEKTAEIIKQTKDVVEWVKMMS